MSLPYVQTATAAATNSLIAFAADHHPEVAAPMLDHVARLVKAIASDLGWSTSRVDALSAIGHSLGQLRMAEAEHCRHYPAHITAAPPDEEWQRVSRNLDAHLKSMGL